MQKIFEISTSRGGDQYWKLKIMPADGVPIDESPEVVAVSPAAIGGMVYSYEYDDYPVGMPAAPVLELTFNLDFCPTDLVTTLFEPFAVAGGTIHTSTHTYFNLWVDGVEGVVFEGVQKSGGASSYDAVANTLTVEFYHIARVLFENYSLADLNGYTGFPNTTPDRYLHDITIGTSAQFLTHLNGIDSVEYVTIADIENYISSRLGALAKLFRRESELPRLAYTFAFGLPDLYVASDTGARGSLLSKSQMGLIARLWKNAAVVAGAFHVSEGLGGQYQNLWDFMSDQAGGSLRRGVCGGSSFELAPLFTADTFTIDDFYIMGKPEINWRYEPLKTVAVENMGAIEDDATESRDSWGGSRAEATLSQNILLNNLPTQTEFKIVEGAKKSYLTNAFSPFKVYNILTTRPERVHEYANYQLGDGTDTDTVSPRGTVDYAANITRYLPTLIQRTSGMPNSVARTYRKILSSDRQAKLKLKARNEGLKFEIFYPKKALEFDPSIFTPTSITGVVSALDGVLPSKYYITSVSVDFIADEFELELFGYGDF